MELHETEAFREWYRKPIRVQPSGNIQKDFSMLCWIISYSGRITSIADSFERWKSNYLKFRDNAIVCGHDKTTFFTLFEKYNMKNAEQLGLQELRIERDAEFLTSVADGGEHHRDFQNIWRGSESACETP